MSKIDKELFTTSAHALEREFACCPECGSELVMREGKKGRFLGCANYPNCHYIRALQPASEMVRLIPDRLCPDCQHPLAVRQGRFGLFIGCSNYPACHHIVHDQQTTDESAIPCPVCKIGHLHERTSRHGRHFYACDRYPECDYLLNAKPHATPCQKCGWPLLIEKKLRGKHLLICPQKECGAEYHESETMIQTNANPSSLLNDDLQQAVAVLQEGGVIAYATEAVFGLGCDPDNGAAVAKLLAIKERPIEKGLILIAANLEQLRPYLNWDALDETAQQRILDSWPGANTWVIPAAATTPKWLTGQFATLAVRVSAHPQVQILTQQFGKPLVSTSANLSGQEPARSSAEVAEQLGERLDYILSGEVGGALSPSQIRDGETGAILRPA